MTKKRKSRKFFNFMQARGMDLEQIPELIGKTPDNSLTIIHCSEGHTHILWPTNKDTAKLLLNEALEDLNYFPTLPADVSSEVHLPKQIVFHNRQAIGDILMFTAGIRDFKFQFPDIKVQVKSTAFHLWDHNPLLNREQWPNVIDPHALHTGKEKPTDIQMLELNKKAILQAVEEDRPVQVYIGPSKATNASNRRDLHFANAFRISMEAALGVTITQGPIRPDIYMSEQEYNAPPLIEPPYWLITAGEKGDWTCKTYPFAFWEAVVKAMPQIKFVQIGVTGHKHPNLKGPNVVNYVGKTQDKNTGIRNLFNLFNYCEGSANLVSFAMHLAAGFNKPCVTIAGAREPVWFTRYPGQQYLATDGCLPCTVSSNGEPTACWKCDIKGCPHKQKIALEATKEELQEVPTCAALIRPEEVVRAIEHYYAGGRLDLKKPSGKSKLVKIVKGVTPSAQPIQMAQPTKELPGGHSMWGFGWGGASITDKDWDFISSILVEEKVKRVLEIGAGLSTILIKGMGIDVVSFETRQKDIDRLKALNPTLDIRLWDGTFKGLPISTSMSSDTIPEKFDLVFIDGPGGGESREPSFQVAPMYADMILIHDAGRPPEKKWAEKHLSPTFSKYSQGGHRTAFWKRRDDMAVAGLKGVAAGKALKEKLLLEDPVKCGDTIILPSSEFKARVNIKEGEMLETKLALPLFRMVFNGRGEGGAERSTTWIMNQFIKEGWNVEYISPNDRPSGTFRKEGNPKVNFYSDLARIKEPCELLMLYTNDWVWEFPKLSKEFNDLQAKRKVMAVNFRLGSVGNPMQAEWTLNWDKYLFLNTSLQNALIQRVPDANTGALAPPIDLREYFETNINYDGNLRIVRHSSQGDAKYPNDFTAKVDRILTEIPDSEIFLMPSPSFFLPHNSWSDRIHCHQRNKPSVREFLAQGNVFWYCLPDGYHDMGPKVIMEAQASGLGIIADNHSGAKDRVVRGTGHLCGKTETHSVFDFHLMALKQFAESPTLREAMGTGAREHAKKTYHPKRWIKEMLQ